MELGIREGGYDSTKMEFPSVRSDSIRLDSRKSNFEDFENFAMKEKRRKKGKRKGARVARI